MIVRGSWFCLEKGHVFLELEVKLLGHETKSILEGEILQYGGPERVVNERTKQTFG